MPSVVLLNVITRLIDAQYKLRKEEELANKIAILDKKIGSDKQRTDFSFQSSKN